MDEVAMGDVFLNNASTTQGQRPTGALDFGNN